MSREEFHILLVEDNPGDIKLTSKGFERLSVPCRLAIAHDGEEALTYLSVHGHSDTPPLPDLIIMDLNLPKLDGLSVMQEIRADERLHQKPVEIGELVSIVESIETFWLSTATLPRP